MPNKEILTITFTFPEEDLVDPHILAQTTPYIRPTPPPPPTSLQCITQKASTTFRGALPSEEFFIAPLSWRPPIWLPYILFKLIFPCQKLLLKVHPSSILGNKFNVSPHTLTWSTKCYATPQNQEGINTFLTLECGMTLFSNSNRTLPSNSIIQRTCIKAKTNNLKTPINSEHKCSIATKELPLMSLCQNHF